MKGGVPFVARSPEDETPAIMNWVLLKNSFIVSGSATLLSATMGFVAALCVAGLPGKWQKAAIALGIIALALPPFVVTNCWLFFLGQTGVWRGWVPFNVMSLGGTILLLALMLWPISFLATLGAWHRLEPHLLESDMAVRGWYLLRGLLFPLCGGALLQAAVLTFVLALNNFAIPAVLQVKVYPAEAWIQYSTNLNPGSAFRLSCPSILAPLLLVAWFSRRPVQWPNLHHPVSPQLFRRQIGAGWFRLSAGVTSCVIFLSVLLPLLQLTAALKTWSELPGALAAGQSALWGSFSLAFAAASLVVATSLLLIPGENCNQIGSRPERLRRWVALIAWIPFLVPGVLLGIALVVALNRSWLNAIYSSAAIVVVAYVLRYAAPGGSLVAQARHHVDRALLDVARLEGANRRQILRHVEWPQVAPQVATAWYLVFVLCLWDVESMILIVPPGMETLALRIFNLLHYGHNSQVDALCLALLAVALIPLCLWYGAASARAWIGSLLQRSTRLPLVVLFVLLLAIFGCSPSGSTRPGQVHSRIFEDVRVLGTRGTGVGQLNKPRSVAVDRQDNLYVVDMTGRVQKFTSNGVFQLSWQMPQTDLGKPKGMCCDSAGNIVVLEPHYARVNHYSTAGKLVSQWGEHGTNTSELSVPRAIGVNERDEIFVTEYQQAERVQKFIWNHAQPTAAPRWQMSFGKPGSGPGEFSRPEGLCVDANGQVFVADSCNHRIQVFTRTGQFVRTYGKPGKRAGELSYPYDICVDKLGRQYVCEFGNSRIQIFDRSGRSIEIIGGPGGDPGRFSNPWGVALDSVGNLYVADSLNHRVQKLIRSRRDVERPADAATASAAHRHTDARAT